jgi:hypothetical protein
MRVGVVAEGPTEALLMEALLDSYFPGSEVRRIQPDLTLAAHLGAGWKGVRAWCRENGALLDAVMNGIAGDELNLLVIHADCSMAHNVGAREECPPASDTADALRQVIITDWLRVDEAPASVVLMTPSMTTDTWLFVGAGYAIDELEPIECSFEVEAALARRRDYRWRDGQVKKSGRAVAELAERAVRGWDAARLQCTEASRFWTDFDAASEAI